MDKPFLHQNDGKIVDILTGVGSQRCPFCKKMQSQFSNESLDFSIIGDSAKLGLSTLHAGPNMVKALLKIASQLDFRKHRCAGDKFKDLRDKRKAKNAGLLWTKLEIKVKYWFNVTGQKLPI